MVTATRILASRLYYAAAFEALGDDANGSYVSVQPLGQANIVTIQATAPDPEQAARVANGYAKYVVDERSALFEGASAPHQAAAPPDRRLPEFTARGQLRVSRPAAKLAAFLTVAGTSNPTVQVLAQANIPSVPAWPRPKLSIAAALLAALLVGGAIALLLEFASPRITSERISSSSTGCRSSRAFRVSNRVVRGYLTGSLAAAEPCLEGLPRASLRARQPRSRRQPPALDPRHERLARGREDDDGGQPRDHPRGVEPQGRARRRRPAPADGLLSSTSPPVATG